MSGTRKKHRVSGKTRKIENLEPRFEQNYPRSGVEMIPRGCACVGPPGHCPCAIRYGWESDD